jgi:hypothetical protein
MPRVMHGDIQRTSRFGSFVSSLGLGPKLYNYGYMFPGLAADSNSRLPDDGDIGQRLVRLGASMLESAIALPSGDSPIPSAYTYLGQFIDHNITSETMSGDLGQLGPNVSRIPNAPDVIKNLRTGVLDLVSVYDAPAPRDPTNNDLMLLGRVSPSGNRPVGKDDFNDLPRQPRSGETPTSSSRQRNLLEILSSFSKSASF